MSAKPKIKPELKDAWEKTNDSFISMLSLRQRMSFSKVALDGDKYSLKPSSPQADLAKIIVMQSIPSSENKELAFVSLVNAFISSRTSVVSSMVDKDLDGTKHFHRSNIEVEETLEKLVILGVKLEK